MIQKKEVAMAKLEVMAFGLALGIAWGTGYL